MTKRRESIERRTQALSEWAAALASSLDWQTVKKIGRPSKLTPELIEALAAHIAENGSYIDDTCALFGISRTIFYRWKRQGEQDREAGIDSAHAAFVDTLEKADAFVRAKIAKEAYTGGNKWISMMTLGERKYPEKYGRRQESSDAPKVIVQIGVKDGDVKVQLGAGAPHITAGSSESA